MSLHDAENETAEAAADALEQQWMADQDAAALAANAPGIGETADAQAAWEVGGDKEAMWAIDRIVEASAEVDRIRRNAQLLIEQIQAKATADEAQFARTVDFFTGKLIAYRRRLEAENPRLPKTYRLGNGDLCVRAGRRSTRVTDEAAFVEWAKDAAPEALSYKPRVSALRDLDLRVDSGRLVDPSSGETVPGVVEVEGDPSYSVKPLTPEPEPF